MTHSRRILYFLLAGAAGLAACDDGANETPPVEDMTVPEPEPDPEPDADPDMFDPDMNVMDAQPDAEIDAEPDAIVDAIIDAEIDANTIVMPGPMCAEDDECLEDWRRCLGEQCQIDMRPNVFVVSAIRVVEPAESAQLIETFLGDAVDDHLLNLIIEPGGYNDANEYLWYIGNGGFRNNEYDYLGLYPVQNFYGLWRDDEENGLRWAPDDEVAFLLNVPTGQVENAQGDTVNCISQIATTVDLTLTPSRDDQGDPLLNANLTGSLRRADAERVQFRFAGGAVIQLVDLLDDADLNIDTDGDGVADAYPFAFDADATPVVFIGDPPAEDGSNRDPNPELMNDPACNE